MHESTNINWIIIRSISYYKLKRFYSIISKVLN
jgi:hypothetical protein